MTRPDAIRPLSKVSGIVANQSIAARRVGREVPVQPTQPLRGRDPGVEFGHLPQLDSRNLLYQQPVLARRIAGGYAEPCIGEDAICLDLALRVIQEGRFHDGTTSR